MFLTKSLSLCLIPAHIPICLPSPHFDESPWIAITPQFFAVYHLLRTSQCSKTLQTSNSLPPKVVVACFKTMGSCFLPLCPPFFLPSNFRSLLSPCLIALLVLGMYKIRIDVVFSLFLRALEIISFNRGAKSEKFDESYDVGIPYDRRGSACEVTLENDEHDTTRTVAAPLPTVAAVVL